MSARGSTPCTRVLLSFSSAYAELARRIANDLSAANIEVRYDQWEGGGGVPATQCIAGGVDDVKFVLPLLTPSDVAPAWVADEWRRAIDDPATARGIEVLPVRGDGDLGAIPDFLRDRSFADLRGPDYAFELRRLVETIRNRSGDSGIELPDHGNEAGAKGSSTALAAEPLSLEVAAQLAPLFVRDAEKSRFVNEMVPMMLDGLFYELGVQFPAPALRVNSDLPPSTARIVINGIAESQVEVRPGEMMVNESTAAMAELGISAEPATNPATGAACAWIAARHAAAARDRGLTTWDAQEFSILALSSTLRRKAADFIGIDEARAMLERIEPVFPLLVAETVPKAVSLFVLTDVLRRLVAELVSVRDLRGVLMSLAKWGPFEHDPLMLADYVRSALNRQITHWLSRGTRRLVVFLLDPEIERSIRDSIRHTATGSYVDLGPARLREIVEAIRERLAALPNGVQVPAILTVMEIRSCVRRLVATSMPFVHVVCYQDLRPDADIHPVGRISLAEFRPRTGVGVG